VSPLPKRGFALAQETPHGAATDKLFDSAHLRASGTQQIEKLSGSILQYRAGSNSGQLLVDFQTITPVQIIPQVPTCRVSASTINLPLGNVFFPSSTPVGTTASEQAFNISLNRAGGNIATASQASNATGVGIQITRLDTPLKFGQNSAAAGNTNQWFAGNAVFGQGKLDIPLKARYLKTVAQVMSGKANGAATFTMSYQ